MPILDLDKDLLALEGLAVRRGSDFAGPEAVSHYPPDLEIEPEHLTIDLEVDIPGRRAAGTVTTRVKASRAGVRTLVLDAVDFTSLHVADPAGRDVVWTYDGKKIRVTWQEPFKVGEVREIAVKYAVVDPVSGLFFMEPDEHYPERATYAATDHETERARHWLPCIDHPNVRTTLEFRLTAAENLTILANGVLVSETRHDTGELKGKKTAVWKLDQRCPSYLVCFAIGDFTVYDDGEYEGIPLAYFTSRDFTPEDLKRSFGRTKDMLAWMTKRLGTPFPYPKYYQFALPNFSGAMENISLVSWTDSAVLNEDLAPEWTWWVDQVNVHEMAHSYFGDLVVCRDFAHAWLKESWATYIETCWLEDSKGEDEQLYDLFRNAEAYFKEADEEYKRPLVTRKFASSWQMYDRHLYPGGACRIHTLRRELGDEVFWPAVKDYLATFAEKTVETRDFRAIMEKWSGRSLVRFFEQWVFTPDYPRIKVEFNYDSERKIGTFVVEQTQVDAEKGIPAFELRTELGWTIDGKEHREEIRLDQARHSFTFAMSKEPEQVRFDPGWRILHKLDFKPGDDKLKAQLTGAKDVVGRILAARELCSTGKRANIEAVLKAYDKEPFWGVRREMAGALQTAQTEDALKGLIEILHKEKDPMVLDRVASALGAYRDERVAQALRERIAVGDLPPVAEATCLASLGRQRHKEDLELFMEKALAHDRQTPWRQRGGLTALGLSRRNKAGKFLRDKAPYGKLSYKARPALMSALGAVTPYLKKKEKAAAEDALLDRLRDPEGHIRIAAAHALASAGVKRAASAIRQLANSVSRQEAVSLNRLASGIEKADENKVAALEKTVDDLREQLRKLEARLGDLEGRSR